MYSAGLGSDATETARLTNTLEDAGVGLGVGFGGLVSVLGAGAFGFFGGSFGATSALGFFLGGSFPTHPGLEAFDGALEIVIQGHSIQVLLVGAVFVWGARVVQGDVIVRTFLQLRQQYLNP